MSAENQFNLETIEVSTLPELQGWKEKQETIVLDNPFIEIIDNKTYEEAKKARTTLVSARTTIEKQDKLIASKLKDVRTKAGKFSLELVNITLPHEEKQQEEVKRYEAVKEAERVAKEKAERERKDAIEKNIESICQTAKSKIDNLNFTSIEVLKNDFENNLYKTDVSEFEEFELQFASKVQILKQQLEDKIKVVTEKENQRIEAENLAKAKADFEAEKLAKAKADKAVEEKRIADQKVIDDANKKRQEELDGKQKAIEEKEAIIEEKTEVLIEKEKAIEEKTVAKSEPTPTPVPAPVPAPVPTSTPTTPIEEKESKAIRIIIDAIANLNIEEINEAIKNNEITIDEMVAEFKKQLITLIK